MNNNINIAEILKDCPKGIKLYSPLLGNVTLEKVDINSTIPIRVNDGFNSCSYFTKTGLYYYHEDGECLLFPSSKMRDWTKFFKRGDVVRNKAGNRYAIFDCWESDDYTNFNTTISYSDESSAMFYTKEVYNTSSFVKASAEEGAVFISNVEKYYDGKYNPKTLQVEPIKSKCEFKPFDKVLVRDNINEKWIPSIFLYIEDEVYNDFPYICLNGRYSQCIPYEGNEYFVGKKVNIH